MINKEVEGAKEFLLQEYQSLYALHQEAKAVGETRLNFFVTFVAAVSTGIITVQSFIAIELRAWLVGGIAAILIMVGLITYRKMLQRRVAVVLYRRRLNRIREWFIHYYPPVVSGLPYDTNHKVRMDWGGKGKLGSTAFSVAFLNTALILLSMLSIGFMSFGSNAAVWVISASTVGAMLSWFFHILWKNHWMKAAEIRDEEDLRELDKIKPKHPRADSSRKKTKERFSKVAGEL